MYFAIYACDCLYEGLHGMYDCGIFKFFNIEDALIQGREMSRQVIESYSDILDTLEEDFREYVRENMFDDELNDLWEDIVHSDISYEIRLLKSECLANSTIAELEEEFYNDPQEFLQNYCMPLDN